MESYISNELNLRFPPIVLLKSDERPEDAKGPKSGKGGCVMKADFAEILLYLTVDCKK